MVNYFKKTRKMSYYKTEKPYDEMSVKELEGQKLRHFYNPKYYLKLIKPPFYYTWMHLLNLKIEKRKQIDKESSERLHCFQCEIDMPVVFENNSIYCENCGLKH